MFRRLLIPKLPVARRRQTDRQTMHTGAAKRMRTGAVRREDIEWSSLVGKDSVYFNEFSREQLWYR